MILQVIHVVGSLLFEATILRYDLNRLLSTRRKWAVRTLKNIGVQIEIQGSPPEGNHIYLGNHRSYLDPIVVLCNLKAVPVAKAEVASWPLIGYGAKISGIMFVRRESKTSRANTLDAMKEVLQSGYSVLVYPEGTTHTLPHTMDFRLGAFKLAAKEGFRVVPIAMDYEDINDAWIGEEGFAEHFLRCFGRPVSRIKIAYGEPVEVDNPIAVSKEIRDWIDKKLTLFRLEFEQKKFTESIIN